MAKILEYRELPLAGLLVDKGQVEDPAQPEAKRRLDFITF